MPHYTEILFPGTSQIAVHDQPYNLRDYRGLWLELATLVQEMGHVFTINFIILFIKAIANTSSLLYGFLTHREVGTLWLVFGLVILATTGILINTAHEAAQEVQAKLPF